MPTAAEVKDLAFDPVDRWAAVPDAVITRLIGVVTRSYAGLAAEPETEDLIAYHTAHMLAVAGVGADGGGVGPVSSTSVSLGGARASRVLRRLHAGARRRVRAWAHTWRRDHLSTRPPRTSGRQTLGPTSQSRHGAPSTRRTHDDHRRRAGRPR